MSDWNAVIASDIADAEYKPPQPIPDGLYNALLTDVEAKTFKSGSKGLEVTFLLSDEGTFKSRTVKDYYIIRNASGQPDKNGGPAKVKKLLLECGLTVEQIQNFSYPDFDSGRKAGFVAILEKPVTVELKNTLQKKGENAGKTFTRVNKVTKA